MIATGDFHSCGVTTAGVAWCWGHNNRGQLGNRSTIDSATPVGVVGLPGGASEIAAGAEFTCALTRTGGVKCWGRNDQGQLGNVTTMDSTVPVDVFLLTSGATEITAGQQHACALTTAGAVKCWGNNAKGQLGTGTTIPTSIPAGVVGLSNGVVAIAAGDQHTCALTIAGGVKCWGNNGDGQLGDGTKTNSTLPVDVVGLGSGVVAIAAGGRHTCAVTVAGGVKCWGKNGQGELGDGTKSSNSSPVDVVGLGSGVAAVAAGDQHTCAVTTAGAVKCWGLDSQGQLGDGSTTTNSSIPVDVAGLGSGMAAIAAGNQHSCALATAGGAYCWGNNKNGQLGDGTTSSSAVPVAVLGFP